MTTEPSLSPHEEPAPSADELKARTPEERRKTYISWTAFGMALVVCALLKPDWAKTTAIFLVVLGVLVFVHEWGHYQFARWGGMKVNRFAIGFPPFIFTRYKNGIAYSLGALPIGGMVDIAGLGSEEEMVAQVKGEEVASPTRIERRPDLPRGQRQFQDAPFVWRFLTLFAGPMMNFLFAITMFVLIYSIKGVPQPQFNPYVSAVAPGMPAAKAGMRAGDYIWSVNGQFVNNSSDVSRLIHQNGTKAAKLTVVRDKDKKKVSLTLTPIMRDLDGDKKLEPSIGIAFDMNQISSFTFEKKAPLVAVEDGFLQSVGVALDILDTINRATHRQLSSDEVKGIGGPLKIAQTTGQAASFGPFITLHFAALLSVNLGLLNLLPIPALDGGRILFLFIGSVYERLARRPLDPRKETMVHLAGMMLLLAFMLFITARDLWPFLQRHMG